MNTARRLVGSAFAVAVATLAVLSIDAEVASVPSDRERIRAPSLPTPAFDVWGRSVWSDEVASLDGDELDGGEGAIAIDDELLALGERAFHTETFGNEVVLTDVVGLIDGPVELSAIAGALAALGGEATTNLRVPLAADAVVGGRRFRAGEAIDSGLDVPAGWIVPLGVAVRVRNGRPAVGITCALCHASVDRRSGRVIAGVPNADLAIGVLLALATNSSALFPHACPPEPARFRVDPTRTIVDAGGELAALPDAAAFEDAVDRVLLAWPPGRFDATPDGVVNPTDIPDAFTAADHPYGWSGHAAAGPFRGLVVASATAHAPADVFASAAAAPVLHGLDPEVYLGLLLQNAPEGRFRVEVGHGRRPSAVLREADPDRDVAGVQELAAPPTFPGASLVAPGGVLLSPRGAPFLRHASALAAWQNTLAPPPPPVRVDEATASHGRRMFERAGCPRCHGGEGLTGHRVVAAAEIGTDPSRAAALRSLEPLLAVEARLWGLDEPVPLGDRPRAVDVPLGDLDPEQVALAWAHGGTDGGYRTPSLVGLRWTAPYLHDGGVAVGSDPLRTVGVVATVARGIPADPRESLRAVVDRRLRRAVVAANRVAGLEAVHVTGRGHPYWVDAAAGFDEDDQEALLAWLLAYEAHPAALVRPPLVARGGADVEGRRSAAPGDAVPH